MPLPVAELVVRLFLAYAALGVLFALAFVTRGLARVDPAARGVSPGLRLLLLPASAALWPWLLARWLRGGGPPEQHDAHRDAGAEPRTEEAP